MNIGLLIALIGVFSTSRAQENAQRELSNAVLECYNTTEILLQDNKLPHNMHAFIAIIRKIEDYPDFQMDMRQLSVGLLHRFRQSGISESPPIVPTPGITPYAPTEYQFFSHARTLKLIPDNVRYFPNSSISLIERCSLHSMISNSIDTKERGDESATCRLRTDQYRIERSLQTDDVTVSGRISTDVETLTPEELETIKNKSDSLNKDSNSDPNWLYPALPPNHPLNAQIMAQPLSKCPSESGVISTEWGTLSGGPVIAGIAAALQPQNVKIADILLRQDWKLTENLSSMTLDNKWLATLAGDLAEVAIHQGPQRDRFVIGVGGHWNSSVTPKSYFVEENQDTEFTAAEVRGDLDGLILGSEVEAWYRDIPTLKLSQVLDMYYSDRGVFNTSIRACNRRALLTAVAPNDTASAQAYSASVVLYTNLLRYSISRDALKRFAVQATSEFFAFVPSMDNDKICRYTDSTRKFDRVATDLTIIIDTNWDFVMIQSILTILLENVEINKYNSNFTLINGWNGAIMINSSNSILDFYNFNQTQYLSHAKGFDIATAFDKLESIQTQKLNRERELRMGGQRSDILLFIPFTASSISDGDKTYCMGRISKMREYVPDATILFLVAGSKDNWGDFTKDYENDIVSIGVGSMREARGPIMNLVNRIKRVPRRLINSQCGANFEAVGDTASYTNYLEPSGINFYRLHPNYFYASDGESVVNIQTSSGGTFTICESRNLIHINSTDSSVTCTKVDRVDTHRITISCADASHIHECNPLYISIAVNATNTMINRCTDPKQCRYPDAFKYTISYENLKCASGANSIIASSILPVIFSIYIYIGY